MTFDRNSQNHHDDNRPARFNTELLVNLIWLDQRFRLKKRQSGYCNLYVV